MSGLRCWPGCLAIQVRACLPENVGRVVEVLRRCGEDEDGPLWRVKTRKARGICTRTGRVVGADEDVPQVAPDAWLLPLLPPPAAESTTTDADKPVEVLA